MDIIGGIIGSDFPQSKFRATRLFYPLFCAIFHLKFGMPRFGVTRLQFRSSDYPKLKACLEVIDELLVKIEEAAQNNESIKISNEERKFYDAYREHWVHADKRTTLAQYICKQFIGALRG